MKDYDNPPSFEVRTIGHDVPEFSVQPQTPSEIEPMVTANVTASANAPYHHVVCSWEYNVAHDFVIVTGYPTLVELKFSFCEQGADKDNNQNIEHFALQEPIFVFDTGRWADVIVDAVVTKYQWGNPNVRSLVVSWLVRPLTAKLPKLRFYADWYLNSNEFLKKGRYTAKTETSLRILTVYSLPIDVSKTLP